MIHVIVVIHFVAVPRTDQIHFVANFNTHAVMGVDIESEVEMLVFGFSTKFVRWKRKLQYKTTQVGIL